MSLIVDNHTMPDVIHSEEHFILCEVFLLKVFHQEFASNFQCIELQETEKLFIAIMREQLWKPKSRTL